MNNQSGKNIAMYLLIQSAIWKYQKWEFFEKLLERFPSNHKFIFGVKTSVIYSGLFSLDYVFALFAVLFLSLK